MRRRGDGSTRGSTRSAGVLARRLGLGLAAAIVLGGCDFGIPDPVTEQGAQTHTLWRIYVFSALAVGVLVWGLILWAAIRYRRRSDRVPGQRQYFTKLEVTYTIIPLVIVGVLFAFSLRTQGRVVDLDPDPDVVVEVLGFQWQWQFHYPDAGVTIAGTPDNPPELVVPAERTVRLHLVANDVIHSFWVPEFLEKRDLIPGIDNQIDIDVEEPGVWDGRCAEYCGLDHWRMSFTARALPPDEFEEWLADQEGREQPQLAGADETSNGEDG